MTDHDIDLSAAVEAADGALRADSNAADNDSLDESWNREAEIAVEAALPHILAQVPVYIPPTEPKPGTRWEYGIMRPASMPDMSGRPRWTLIVGATFASKEQAENARRRVPSLRGVPAVICRRLVSDWEETK